MQPLPSKVLLLPLPASAGGLPSVITPPLPRAHVPLCRWPCLFVGSTSMSSPFLAPWRDLSTFSHTHLLLEEPQPLLWCHLQRFWGNHCHGKLLLCILISALSPTPRRGPGKSQTLSQWPWLIVDVTEYKHLKFCLRETGDESRTCYQNLKIYTRRNAIIASRGFTPN